MAYDILIVDDSETVRVVVKKTLALTGVEIGELYEASDGGAGLEVLRKERVDLVFADLNMPRMDGVEMIESMRRDKALREIPVVVISTEGSNARLGQLHDQGISACIRKPFTPERFSQVVHEVMEEQDATRSA